MLKSISTPGWVSVFFVAFSGINIVSSGHISQNWISSSWATSSWLFVILFGMAFAMTQASAVAEASGLSAAPEAETALAYRSGHPATVFSVRSVTLFAASALLGAVLPMVWEIVVHPAILILSERHQILPERLIVQTIEPGLLRPKQLFFDGVILLLAFASVGLFRAAKLRGWASGILAVVILCGFMVPSFLLLAFDPPSSGKADCPEQVRPYCRVVSEHYSFERRIAQIVSQNQDLTSDTQGESKASLVQRNDQLELYVNERSQEFRSARYAWNAMNGEDFPQNRTVESLRSLIGTGKRGVGINTILGSLSAACVGGWIFFSFFSLGATHSNISSTSARKDAIFKGSRNAILLSGALFLIAWISLNFISTPEYNALAANEFMNRHSFLPPTTLHVYGLLHEEGIHTLLYLLCSGIWTIALIVLVSTYLEFIIKSERGVRVDVATNKFSRAILPLICLLLAALGYLTARTFGLFAAQVGLFLATAGTQAILVYLSVSGMRKRYEVRESKPFRFHRASGIFLVLTAILLVCSIIPVWTVADPFSAPQHLKVGLIWAVIFGAISAMAFMFYRVRRQRVRQLFSTDIVLTYDGGSTATTSEPHLTKVLIVNGLFGSRTAVTEALELAVSEQIDLLVFGGPLFSNVAILVESDRSQKSPKRTFRIVADNECITTASQSTSEVSLNDVKILRAEGNGLGRYSYCGTSSFFDAMASHGKGHDEIISHIIEDESNWLNAQISVAETLSSKLHCCFASTTELDNSILCHFSDSFDWLRKRLVSERTNTGKLIVDEEPQGPEKHLPLSDLKVVTSVTSSGNATITIGGPKSVESEGTSFSIAVPRSYSESGALVASIITIDSKNHRIIGQLAVR